MSKTSVLTAALFPEYDALAAASGKALKKAAMTAVAEHASIDWLSAAKHAGVLVAQSRPEFTTDPIWKILELQAVARPHEPRAMGPVMDALVRAGVCVKTQRFSPSARPECHRRPLAIYTSLICS